MSADHQQFSGTAQYIATDSLKLAVKAARSLQKPLLVKGEPGTGKTLLAEQVAERSPPPKHSKACMNTMRCRACVIVSLVMTVSMTSRTTSSRVNCGKHLPAKNVVSC